MEPVADGSRGWGGGVGVSGRRSRGQLRRRGGEGVRVHAGAEEDGERLRGVVPGHVTPSGSPPVTRPEAKAGREAAPAVAGSPLASGGAVPTLRLGSAGEGSACPCDYESVVSTTVRAV